MKAWEQIRTGEQLCTRMPGDERVSFPHCWTFWVFAIQQLLPKKKKCYVYYIDLDKSNHSETQSANPPFTFQAVPGAEEIVSPSLGLLLL